MSGPPVLLSRSLDAALGVFTGVLAFYLHETNPRTAPAPGETLAELVRWKRDKRTAQREKDGSDSDIEARIQELLREGKGKAEST